VGQTEAIAGRFAPLRAAKAKIAFASTNPEVLAVDRAGRLVAKAPGSARITVQAGGKAKSYRVVVTG
jgi:uncharacterized protein YjdB